MKKIYDLTAPDGIDPQELDEFNQLVTIARDDATESDQLARMRDYLIRFPDLASQLGDIAGFSLQSLSTYAAGDTITQESIRASAAEFKRQLARPGDSPLEKFAIDQCVHAHLLHYTIELRYLDAHTQPSGTERSLYWEQRLTISQKRYMRALNNLARLRRFALPPIQINIAESQTNISAPGASLPYSDPHPPDESP